MDKEARLRVHEARVRAALRGTNPPNNPAGIGGRTGACGIACPTCGQAAPVLDSRTIPDGRWRRRRCPAGHRFSTLEKVHEFQRGWYKPPDSK